MENEETRTDDTADQQVADGHRLNFDSWIGEEGDHIPDLSLADFKQDHAWICWRYEEKDGKPTKVPMSPDGTHRTGTNDKYKQDWTTFEAADQAAHDHGYDGAGFVLHDEMFLLDIDNRDLDDPLAVDLLRLCDSYTEKSPSGKGVHVYGRMDPGELPDGYPDGYYQKNPNTHVELYVGCKTNRFATFTGDTVKDLPLKDCTAGVIQTLNKHMVKQSKKAETADTPAKKSVAEEIHDRLTSGNQSDDDIVAAIMDQRNGNKFFELYVNGRWEPEYTSQSEADLALCSMVAFRTQDPAQVARIFMRSELAKRDKAKRQDYVDDTVSKALASTTEHWHPAGSGSGQTEHVEVISPPDDPTSVMDQLLADIYDQKYKPISTGLESLDTLLSGGMIPQTLTLIGSEPGTGKTNLCCQLLERRAELGHPVIYFNLEMSTSQLLTRSLSRLIWRERKCVLRASDILTAYDLSDDNRKRIQWAADYWKAHIAPHMQYNPGGSVCSLSSIMDYIQKEGDKALEAGTEAPTVCVDYLHCLSGTPSEDAAALLKRAMTDLKAYAVKYNTQVWAIQAQSRATNKEGRPTMAAGRDSSVLEYGCDYQLMMIRNKKLKFHVDLTVTKSRFTAFDQDKSADLSLQAGSYFQDNGIYEPVYDEPKKKKKSDDGAGKATVSTSDMMNTFKQSASSGGDDTADQETLPL